ncbi:hypothetical protein [Cytobacillus sp. IB215665]|uniref:hypothetical protein n=1 Tax=Cytobacillus sp. IB215665 TaxID=3097357 RepID=UPI002A0B1033|nr:hypothetical protein [Cytobacillus sp. IB215665]MDX8367769.1 hypothetical protein [Cytobacillus sp. IB215665]
MESLEKYEVIYSFPDGSTVIEEFDAKSIDDILYKHDLQASRWFSVNGERIWINKEYIQYIKILKKKAKRVMDKPSYL